MEAYNLLALLLLSIINASVAELKNQTDDIEDSDFDDPSNLTADQGNWTVGDCIIVKMAAQVINIHFANELKIP